MAHMAVFANKVLMEQSHVCARACVCLRMLAHAHVLSTAPDTAHELSTW